MNINNLPTEILEKIIFQGNYFSILKVCKKWHEIAKLKRNKFNDFFF